jgi:hypothetical protein
MIAKPCFQPCRKGIETQIALMKAYSAEKHPAQHNFAII